MRLAAIAPAAAVMRRTSRCLPASSRSSSRAQQHSSKTLLVCRAMAAGAADDDWRRLQIRDAAAIRQLALSAKRVAVLGIKDQDKASQPAHFVAAYLQAAGVTVVPVPVLYPDATHMLGQPVYRRVQDVPGPIDIVDVFRKPSDLAAHLDDLLAARPACVWLQSGISEPAFEEALARAGIRVVSDACLKVEHQQAAAQASQAAKM